MYSDGNQHSFGVCLRNEQHLQHTPQSGQVALWDKSDTVSGTRGGGGGGGEGGNWGLKFGS